MDSFLLKKSYIIKYYNLFNVKTLAGLLYLPKLTNKLKCF